MPTIYKVKDYWHEPTILIVIIEILNRVSTPEALKTGSLPLHERSQQASKLTDAETKSVNSIRRFNISDEQLIRELDSYSIEDVVELKIARFLDQLGPVQPDNVYELIIGKVEKPLITQILRRVGGNQVQASRILGINRNTLRKKIKSYGL